MMGEDSLMVPISCLTMLGVPPCFRAHSFIGTTVIVAHKGASNTVEIF